MTDWRETAEQPTHGNAAIRLGTCDVCGRHDVPLTEGAQHCANEFACLEAFTAREEARRAADL